MHISFIDVLLQLCGCGTGSETTLEPFSSTPAQSWLKYPATLPSSCSHRTTGTCTTATYAGADPGGGPTPPGQPPAPRFMSISLHTAHARLTPGPCLDLMHDYMYIYYVRMYAHVCVADLKLIYCAINHRCITFTCTSS